MNAVFNNLPWIDSLYLFLMLTTGTILVISGLLNRPSHDQPPKIIPSPRGFEVIGVSDARAGD